MVRKQDLVASQYLTCSVPRKRQLSSLIGDFAGECGSLSSFPDTFQKLCMPVDSSSHDTSPSPSMSKASNRPHQSGQRKSSLPSFEVTRSSVKTAAISSRDREPLSSASASRKIFLRKLTPRSPNLFGLRI